MGFFPVDRVTLQYLQLSGRSDDTTCLRVHIKQLAKENLCGISYQCHEHTLHMGPTMSPPGPHPVKDAYCLLNFGDSITTDHISPAGSIHKDGPAAKFLMDCGAERKDFNSYGSRRGNDEVMARGTFANIRLVNKLLKGEVAPKTIHIQCC